MKIERVFQIKGNIHDIVTGIYIDRELTGKERACKTALVGDLELSVGSTSLADLMWTGDEIPDPKALIGQEIVFL